MIMVGNPQSLINAIDIVLRGLDALGGFFLESMQDINHLSKAHRGDSSIGIAVVVLHHLKNSGPLPLPWLSSGMLAAELSDSQSVAHFALHWFGKAEEVFFRRSNPIKRPFANSLPSSHGGYPILGIKDQVAPPNTDGNCRMAPGAERAHVGAMSTIDDQRWEIVRRRLPADFLYGVRTMGIYCRTGCPSPAPKRENARFFATAAAAEAAGFRACRRCDPKGERAAIA